MAETDIWNRINTMSDSINKEIAEIKVQIARLEVKMYFGIIVFGFFSSLAGQLVINYFTVKQ